MIASLSNPETETLLAESGGALKEIYGRILALSRIQDLLAWERSRSIWPFNFGLSCCYVEMATSIPANTILLALVLR